MRSLCFEVIKDEINELKVAVPYSKTDITLPADIVEEIVRIDGLENIEIKGSMTITPSADENILKENLREKIAGYLTGLGFNEIVTNSITNSKYYSDERLTNAVKMINSLSADLNVMRPSMVETGLETIAYNVNRKNKSLQLFEFGKTYYTEGVGNYSEDEHLALYLTGQSKSATWKSREINVDFYYAKGIAAAIIQLCGLSIPKFEKSNSDEFEFSLLAKINDKIFVTVGEISANKLKRFEIKQPVFFIDFNWLLLLKIIASQKITYKEVSKFPAVNRDLAVVVNNNITFEALQQAVDKAKINRLQQIQLFDIFESEKLGKNKKSLAVSFTFEDEEKTLTDKEIDGIMNTLVRTFETELHAEIRK